MDKFEPKITAFVCNWCSYAGADQAGGLKLHYSTNIRLVRVMCSGRVDPEFIIQAFHHGADGVMVLGCHPGDCHYRSGNIKAMNRMVLMHRLLEQLGIDKRRLSLDWVSASEGRKFQAIAHEMVRTIEQLGPLHLPEQVDEEEYAL